MIRRSDSGGLFVSRPNFTHTEASRPLLTPDELRRLPRDAAITLLANRHPILGTYLPYFRHPTFAARARMLPPETTERIAHDWSHWTGFKDPAAPREVQELAGATWRKG